MQLNPRSKQKTISSKTVHIDSDLFNVAPMTPLDWLREVKRAVYNSGIPIVRSKHLHDPQIIILGPAEDTWTVCIAMDRHGIFHGFSMTKEYVYMPENITKLAGKNLLSDLYQHDQKWIYYIEKNMDIYEISLDSAKQVADEIQDIYSELQTTEVACFLLHRRILTIHTFRHERRGISLHRTLSELFVPKRLHDQKALLPVLNWLPSDLGNHDDTRNTYNHNHV